MQIMIENFHFLRPWFLGLLLLPAIIYWRFYNRMEMASSWEKVCDRNLLKFLLVKGSSLQRRLIFYLGIFGFVSTVIAIAGPSWIKQEVEGVTEEKPLMIVLNLSSDMAEKDLTPNRLSRAKYAVSDLLKSVGQTQSGLIVYAGEPFLISPITEDVKVLQNLLPVVDFDIMPENGDRLDRAIELAVESFKNGGWSQGQIVVFAADVGQEFAETLKSVNRAVSEGYKINVVNASAKANDKLEKIATLGQGKFEEIKNASKLGNFLAQQQNAEIKASQNKVSQWLDEGYYLSFIPLICCLYLFRKGLFILLFCLLCSSPVYAGFFLNADQEGLQAFNKEDYQSAAEKFKEPQWQASSYYRLGDYTKAYQYFLQGKGTENLYNQGNALAKSGKIDEAIQKYEEVLKQNPQHEDAKFNLEYLKQQQNQQQPQSGSDENQDKEQEQQQNQQKSQAENNNQQNQNQTQNGKSDSEDETSSSNSQQNKQSQTPQQDSSKAQQSSEKQSDKGQENSQTTEQSQSGKSQEQQDKEQDKQGQALQMQNGDHTYNEEVQARELQYREIPEDMGGLLRAFIAREYAKNRYAKGK